MCLIIIIKNICMCLRPCQFINTNPKFSFFCYFLGHTTTGTTRGKGKVVGWQERGRLSTRCRQIGQWQVSQHMPPFIKCVTRKITLPTYPPFSPFSISLFGFVVHKKILFIYTYIFFFITLFHVIFFGGRFVWVVSGQGGSSRILMLYHAVFWLKIY